MLDDAPRAGGEASDFEDRLADTFLLYRNLGEKKGYRISDPQSIVRRRDLLRLLPLKTKAECHPDGVRCRQTSTAAAKGRCMHKAMN